MSVAIQRETNQRCQEGAAGGETLKTHVHETLRLIVVGGGMASYGLCDRLVRSGAIRDYDVTVFGEEPTPAYDRVNLSQLFSGVTADELRLADTQWYETHRVKLKTGCRIAQIDRKNCEVVDQHGQRHPYDRLVIATGSRARVPPIPGADSQGVFVYRTLADLNCIQEYVDATDARIGAVMGGGLLGLEAAKVLQDLGLRTSVIEMAPGLMPRQLDAEAASILKGCIESTGVDVHLVRRTEAIHRQDDGRLAIRFANADPLVADLLIIAAGVVPNDELARDSGLEVGRRGGIVVDQHLQTSDRHIFAIGECVSFRDHVYGLVAPCYRMADVLAKRLAGQGQEFVGADESVELKLLGVQVVAFGQAIGESPSGDTLTQKDAGGYRKLILENGSIVGAACVGRWDQLSQIRQAVRDKKRLWPWQRTRFLRTGSPWIGSGAMSVADWPSDSIVCSCLGVTKATITGLVEECQANPSRIAEKSGASTACGSCRSLVCELAGASSPKVVVPAARTMLVASILGIIASALLVSLPPIPLADSVKAAWREIDVLWRSDFARQVTGYTLLGLLLVGLVFSLRKRTNWFRWGSYGLWRAVHGVLGTSVLVAVAIHTGVRLGSNLNFVLAVTLIATAALGAVAGVLSSIEGRFEGSTAILVRRWRPRLTQLHLWLFWPLPALIACHVFSFYWFRD